MPPNSRANRYDHTPRKVFDRALDRIELRRQRDKEEARRDIANLFQKMELLNKMLTLLEDHVQSHCHVLSGDLPEAHEEDA